MTQHDTRRALDAALKANKRSLMLLDSMLAEAGEVSPELMMALDDETQCLPFWYPVIGSDSVVGIPVDITQDYPDAALLGATQSFYGYVRTDADSAFVADRIFAALLLEDSSGNQVYWDGQTADAAVGFQLRLFDETNARRLNLSYDASQTPSQLVALPLAMFGPSPFSSQAGLQLPAECTFPRNATIRVEASFTSTWAITGTSSARVSVVFHGHKVFGG